MEQGKIEEEIYQFKLFNTGSLKSGFIPWDSGDNGQQSFIKLKRKDEIAYLYSGVGAILQAEVQKAVMRLVNDGWTAQGEVHVTFEGSKDPGKDMLIDRDSISMEVGSALLPLVDPYQGSLLLERINMIREELALDIGFVIPSVNVKDNMRIEPNCYRIKLRETPIASGEIFLDRFLAIGSLEKLGSLPGWSTQEPVYKMAAKWIEAKDRDKASEEGCMVQGPLNVVLTHLSDVIRSHSKDILGLQDTHHLLERLGNTYPVVVSEFLSDTKKLRKVKQVLQNLLAEHISIKDIVTIMEIIGDNLEDINNASLMTEHVRRGMARQICWSHVDDDGYIKAVVLNNDIEKELIYSLQDTLGGTYLYLEKNEEDKVISAIKKAIAEYEAPPVLLTDPSLRIYLRDMLYPDIPNLTILSTAEIPRDFRITVLGEIKIEIKDQEKNEATEKTEKRRKMKRFWKMGESQKFE